MNIYILETISNFYHFLKNLASTQCHRWHWENQEYKNYRMLWKVLLINSNGFKVYSNQTRKNKMKECDEQQISRSQDVNVVSSRAHRIFQTDTNDLFTLKEDWLVSLFSFNSRILLRHNQQSDPSLALRGIYLALPFYLYFFHEFLKKETFSMVFKDLYGF